MEVCNNMDAVESDFKYLLGLIGATFGEGHFMLVFAIVLTETHISLVYVQMDNRHLTLCKISSTVS